LFKLPQNVIVRNEAIFTFLSIIFQVVDCFVPCNDANLAEPADK